MRSNRPSAAAVARKPRVCAFHARAQIGARARSVRASDLRAIAAADGRFDRIVAQRSANVAQ
eukprot:9918820-Lingulodinium_polyedra.AAC.1